MYLVHPTFLPGDKVEIGRIKSRLPSNQNLIKLIYHFSPLIVSNSHMIFNNTEKRDIKLKEKSIISLVYDIRNK